MLICSIFAVYLNMHKIRLIENVMISMAISSEIASRFKVHSKWKGDLKAIEHGACDAEKHKRKVAETSGKERPQVGDFARCHRTGRR